MLSPLYSFIGYLSYPLVYGAYRLRVKGLDLVPPDGGFVLAANHMSNFDPWPLGIPFWPRRQLYFMAKSELFNPVLAPILNRVGAFPVRRGEADLEAIETAVRICREGNIVAMFPEGTRQTKGLVKKHAHRPRNGSARIAIEAGVPLVPAAILGTDRLARFGPLRVAYGEPIPLDDLQGKPLREAADEATVRLMESIYALRNTM